MAELFKHINKYFEFCFYTNPWFVIYVIISKTVETTESQNVSNNDIKAKHQNYLHFKNSYLSVNNYLNTEYSI